MKTPDKKLIVTKALIICGIISSLLYVCTDIFAAMSYDGYSYTSQQVSELSAIGAPTRSLWVAMSIIWSPLIIGFGIGVCLLASQKRYLRVTGILLAIWGIVGFVWLFFPMHSRGTAAIADDLMHIVFAAAQVILMILFIAFGAVALRWGFRLYSIVTIVALLVFGALVSMQAPAIAAGQPTPWVGVIERVSVYSPIIWVLVFAIVLLLAGLTNTQRSLG